jgi:hypothetical protein
LSAFSFYIKSTERKSIANTGGVTQKTFLPRYRVARRSAAEIDLLEPLYLRRNTAQENDLQA